ncbi:MAG: ATP-binding protein, partial [Thermomicrobiales bacterium]
MGKTQLAIHGAHACAGEYPDGVVFLSFAPIRDPENVLTIIARAVRGDRQGEAGTRSPLAEILASIRERKMLLILDNLEHVAACAPFLSSILAYAPNLTILTTSREALGISGEQVFAVSPLDVPKTSRQHPLTMVEIMGSSAIQLFLTRALGASAAPGDERPHLTPSPALGVMLTRVCRALDGIPLAIELVAARMRADTAAALEQQLWETLRDRPSSYAVRDPLSSGMSGAVQWSNDLLKSEEQRFFERFSVFAGGCPFDA